MDPPSGWVGEEDFLAEGLHLPDPRPDRQVCVRLLGEHYDDLAAAAELYGVSPTTLARMLVRRGAKAVLDSYRRDNFMEGDHG